jgi:hypothetical protein
MGEMLLRLIDSGVRVIEVGATDLCFARFLARRGNARFLCLAQPRAIDSGMEATAPDPVAMHVSPYTGREQLAASNAELLVLPAPMAPHLWNFWNYNHASYVAWSPGPGRAGLIGLLSLVKEVLRHRIAITAVEHLELAMGVKRTFVLVRVHERRTGWAPRYLSPIVGQGGFFETLTRRRVSYVVLRWFDRLPFSEPGEDLDLLVADEHVDAVEQLIAAMPGTIPCDVYSASGRPGTNHHGVSYFPPALAEQILARAEWWKGRYRVPSSPDHFLSLAYHAVYHKGIESGIPTREHGPQNTEPPEHDYLSALGELAQRTGIDVELTLEGLGAYLTSRGWQPPHDTMNRLARQNAWLARRLAPYAARVEAEHLGLAVFILREAACELGLCEQILAQLRAHGFMLLRHKTLDEQERERVRQGARGSNWGKGAYPRSAGGPAVVVVAQDLAPIPPRAELKELYPALSNERVRVKEVIRDQLNLHLPPDLRCNMIHSTDNAAEAIEYLTLALPEEDAELLASTRTAPGSSAHKGASCASEAVATGAATARLGSP